MRLKALTTVKTTFSFLTAPSGSPLSIDNDEDAEKSKRACAKQLTDDIIQKTDAFIVACYSSHPLVPWLQKQPQVQSAKKFVTGIFEASVAVSLRLTEKPSKFGIISSGKVWEKLLTEAVAGLPGNVSAQFGGVTTTGMELDDAAEEIREC